MTQFNIKQLENRHWTSFFTEDVNDLQRIGKTLGQIIPSRRTSQNLVDILNVKSGTDLPLSLSKKFGSGKFPFHTDGAYMKNLPRYIILRSPENIDNCATLLCKPVFNCEQIATLTNDIWTYSGGFGKFYSNIIEPIGNADYRIRFDLQCMNPASNEFGYSKDIMEDIISNSKKTEINWSKNQCVIIDNWKLLHARADASNSQDRILERLLIN